LRFSDRKTFASGKTILGAATRVNKFQEWPVRNRFEEVGDQSDVACNQLTGITIFRLNSV
jgi:hypothetical protein